MSDYKDFMTSSSNDGTLILADGRTNVSLDMPDLDELEARDLVRFTHFRDAFNLNSNSFKRHDDTRTTDFVFASSD